MCGYLTFERYTAFYVRVQGLTCARAASVIDTYLARGAPPTGWVSQVRRFKLPAAGGPPGSADVRGEFRLFQAGERVGLLAWLSKGAQAAPPPVPANGGPSNVHFGCQTRSSICG